MSEGLRKLEQVPEPQQGGISEARPEEKTEMNRFGDEYGNVFIWDAVPNEEDPMHVDEHETLLKILDGRIDIDMDGRNSVLEKGDSILIPAHILHSAKVGLEGCRYIVAEKK
ncbi:MAG: hypothetical protein JWN64_211 [Parcubacteria group bacterium]|nr:hypothetical protein [Parcubacteria group bacterium]